MKPLPTVRAALLAEPEKGQEPWLVEGLWMREAVGIMRVRAQAMSAAAKRCADLRSCMPGAIPTSICVGWARTSTSPSSIALRPESTGCS